jgi:hypothetical protein
VFNHTAVKTHFNLLEKVLKDLGVPWENICRRDVIAEEEGSGRLKSSSYLDPTAMLSC